MKALAALLLLAATPVLAAEGGRDPFALRTPGVTTVVPGNGAPVQQVAPGPAVQAQPAPRPPKQLPQPAASATVR